MSLRVSGDPLKGVVEVTDIDAGLMTTVRAEDVATLCGFLVAAAGAVQAGKVYPPDDTFKGPTFN